MWLIVAPPAESLERFFSRLSLLELNHDINQALITLASHLTRADADRHYLKLARAESTLTNDPKAAYVPRSAVGAVIADRLGILAASANVVPPKLTGKLPVPVRALTDDERYYFIEHAERAAIYKALLDGKKLAGATIYGTRFPCADCARAIVWCGIKRAVFASGFSGEHRWLESQKAALQMMRSSGVRVRIIATTGGIS